MLWSLLLGVWYMSKEVNVFFSILFYDLWFLDFVFWDFFIIFVSMICNFSVLFCCMCRLSNEVRFVIVRYFILYKVGCNFYFFCSLCCKCEFFREILSGFKVFKVFGDVWLVCCCFNIVLLKLFNLMYFIVFDWCRVMRILWRKCCLWGYFFILYFCKLYFFYYSKYYIMLEVYILICFF